MKSQKWAAKHVSINSIPVVFKNGSKQVINQNALFARANFYEIYKVLFEAN